MRQVLDASGSPLLTQTYDPYGSVYESVGAGETSFGFTGEQVDESGLVYLRARYYQPGMGRFLNADPSRAEMNPYQYASSCPINATDPSGLICIGGRNYPPYEYFPCGGMAIARQEIGAFVNAYQSDPRYMIETARIAGRNLGGEFITTYVNRQHRIMNYDEYYGPGHEEEYLQDVILQTCDFIEASNTILTVLDVYHEFCDDLTARGKNGKK